MHIEPFQPKHLEILVLQPSQAAVSVFFDDEYGHALKAAGPCFTAIHEGEILACAGVVKQWENRAIAWGLISANAGKQFVRIHKAVQRFLEATEFKRVEAFVDSDFEPGHRWIKMLGFEYEGYMKNFSPLGRDCLLYSRIKHG